MDRLKLGILISGRGSNMQALLDACAAPDFPAQVAVVLSNQADAAGLERAAKARVPTGFLSHKDFPDKQSFETALSRVLADRGVELVCLAGFMRLLSAWFVERWNNRLINIHPSLLPAFKGLDTHQRAIDAGATEHGCTVHYVRPAMDDGPIILQGRVPVLPGDDAHALADRVLAVEHRIYPLAVRLIAEGRARVENEKVILNGTPTLDGVDLVVP